MEGQELRQRETDLNSQWCVPARFLPGSPARFPRPVPAVKVVCPRGPRAVVCPRRVPEVKVVCPRAPEPQLEVVCPRE